MNHKFKLPVIVGAFGIGLMLLPSWQLYCLKCWAFYPFYKYIIGGFHKSDHFLDGYYYLSTQINPTESIVKSRLYKAKPDDLILSTFPKSGTHAALLMLVHLLSKTELCQKGCDPHEFSYAFEFANNKQGNNNPMVAAFDDNVPSDTYPTTPRIISTHMPATHLNPQESEGKFLVVIRDPVQQLLSLRTMEFFLFGHILRLPLDDFVTLATEIRETGWADHVYQWWRLRKQTNVKVIFYEDLVHNDPEGTVRDVAQFITNVVEEMTNTTNNNAQEQQEQIIKTVVHRMSKEWALKYVDRHHYKAETPFSPPLSFREESGSSSSFIVDSSKFFSMPFSERFSSSQEDRIRSFAKQKLLALDAIHDNAGDGAALIKERASYFM